METVIVFILCGLAVFRLSELLVVDDGPFEIFFRLRDWAMKPPSGTWFRGNLAGVLRCVHCAGLWLAIPFGIWFAQHTDLPWLAGILGVAGLQSVIANKFGRI